jgi:hypothetical protein
MTDVEISPRQSFDFTKGKGQTLLISCGAIAREIVDLIELNNWPEYDVSCLPAKWHNTPGLIVDGVRNKIHAAKANYKNIFVVYGDCGTGGLLDKMLVQEGVERIAGPHCYAFFSGPEMFAKHADDDITSFYLTDYLVRHFEKLIWQGLGLHRHPQLYDEYFGNYRKVVYLAQTEDPKLQQMAKAAADRLELEYEYRFTGYGDLKANLTLKARSDDEKVDI